MTRDKSGKLKDTGVRFSDIAGEYDTLKLDGGCCTTCQHCVWGEKVFTFDFCFLTA